MKRQAKGKSKKKVKKAKETSSEPFEKTKGELIIPMSGPDLMDTDTTTTTTVQHEVSVWKDAVFQARPHALPDMATVRLRPLMQLKGDESPRTISGVLISRLQRTPSPFGNRMGDHTTSWQAVVDSVRASMYGKTVKEAAQTLLTLQAAAQQQVSDADGPARQLLIGLEQVDSTDAANRLVPLENAAQIVADQCALALTEMDEVKAAQALATAVAQHLSFLNYLPFATVPAASARGSKGSGEGTYRGVLLDYEIEAAKPGAAAATKRERGELESALWKMFAFDAVFREAYAEYAMNPQSANEVAKQYAQLENVNSLLDTALEAIAAGAGQSSLEADMFRRLTDQLTAIQQSPGVYKAMHLAAGNLKIKAETVRTLMPQNASADLSAKALKEEHSPQNASILADAKQTSEDIKKLGDRAPEYATTALSNLLQKHLKVMATAYPHAMSAIGLPPADSGKIGDAAADVIVKQLRAQLFREYKDVFTPKTKPPGFDKLLAAVKARVSAMPAIIVNPGTSTWAADATDTNLVVDFDAAKKEALQINGRAPAPPGVAGMGCHTTAWVIQTQYANALVHDAETDGDAVHALQDAVRRDLKSQVMKLTAALPVEQIEARQLAGMFDEAAAVLNAKDAPTAAMAYLSFRNLMPYATVDEGDRSGHAESKEGGQWETFDGEALNLAKNSKRDELFVNAATVATKLLTERDLLAAELDRWSGDDDLAAAVEATRDQLSDLAQRLQETTDPGALKKLAIEESDAVYEARWTEHKKVWKQVQEFMGA